jgi:membrane protease YdiL (CAAX protease family)
MPLKAIWAQNTPYSKLLLTVGIVLVTVTFFTALSVVGASVWYGISLSELNSMLTDYSRPETLGVLRIIQTVSATGTFLLPAFFLAYLFDHRPSSFLSVDRRPGIVPVVLVAVALLAALPLINFLGEINSRMSLPPALSGVEQWMRSSEEQAARLTELFLDMKTPSDLWINLFMMALIPALGEELLFRGIIQRIFSQWFRGIHAAVWITAVLFSAMHFQFYGFLPRMLLGGLLGYLLAWSGSLWLPVTAHFVNNAAAVVMAWLYQTGRISMDPDAIGTGGETVVLFVAAVITAGLLWTLYRYEKRRRAELPG